MPVTIRQANHQATTGAIGSTAPAWSLSPVAGNLLVLWISERNATNGTWPTKPTGYSGAGTTPFIYSTGTNDCFGIFYKIATGGDATPSTCAEGSGTADWTVITAEFVAPAGNAWFPLGTVLDKEAHSAGTSTATTSKASGSTAALAQAAELVVGHLATDASYTTFTSWATLALTSVVVTTVLAKAGWLEVASTAAVGTTATYNTSRVAGCRVATFRFAPSAAAGFASQDGMAGSFEPWTPRSRAFMAVPRLPSLLFASQDGVPYVPPPAPFGAQAFTPLFKPIVIPPTIAGQDGIPFRPPPDPYGAQAFMTPPRIPTTVVAAQDGQPYVPPPDPYGARAYGVYFTPPPPAQQLPLRGGSGPIFPPDPYGAEAFFTPPLLPTLRAAWSSGNRAVFPVDAFGAEAFLVMPPPPPSPRVLSAGSRAVFPPDPYEAQAFLVIPRLPVTYYRAQQAGSDYKGEFEHGQSIVFNAGDYFVPIIYPPGGGGAGWASEYLPGYRGEYDPQYQAATADALERYRARYGERYQPIYKPGYKPTRKQR